MYTLKKIIQALLLPPGAFILFFGVWGLRLLFRRKPGGWGLLGGAAAIYVLSMGLTANLLLSVVEVRVPAGRTSGNPDAIVVLGAGIVEGVPGPSGPAVPNSEMMVRLMEACRLYRAIRKPIIISGSSDEQEGVSEAQVSARVLAELGVPPTDILGDLASRDTIENTANVARILKAHGFKEVLLVTSAYHMRRAALLFKAAGIRFTQCPTYYLVERRSSFHLNDLLPGIGALHKSCLAMKEMMGLLVYMVKYRRLA